MGQEAACRACHGAQTSDGKALLETDYVLFRGDFRLRIPFREMTSVIADGGALRISCEQGDVRFELGAAAAAKWAAKILDPPGRIDKLDVKPAMRVSVLGIRDADFDAELTACNADAGRKLRKNSSLVFYAADEQRDLERIETLATYLAPKGALWIVYPKGVKIITESQVLAAARNAGLTDVKVARFSATHTALKMVIPVAARAKKS